MPSVTPEAPFGVFCGLDVGQGTHHAVALIPTGRQVYDASLPHDEAGLRAVFDELARHAGGDRGAVMVVVDRPTMWALPVVVARAVGCQVAHLPGLSVHRAADPDPGMAVTHTWHAYALADVARSMPQALRRIDLDDWIPPDRTWRDGSANRSAGGSANRSAGGSGIGPGAGFDGHESAAEAARLANRIRGLLTQTHPALERVLGPKVHTTLVLEILSRFGGPTGLRAAGRQHLLAIAHSYAPRAGHKLVDDLLAALDQQNPTIPSTRATETVLPRLAHRLAAVLDQRQHGPTRDVADRTTRNFADW